MKGKMYILNENPLNWREIMKRSHLVLGLTLIIAFSCGLAYGQSSVYVTAVQGKVGTPPDDSVGVSQAIVWTIALRNLSGGTAIATGNGFVIHDNGTGSEWPIPSIDTLNIAAATGAGWKTRFDLAVTVFNDLNNNGGVGVRNADTMGITGANIFGTGFPTAFDFNVMTVTIPAPGINPVHAGKTICLDSARYDVAQTEWLWSTTVGGIIPGWPGPHCYYIFAAPTSVDESITDILPNSFALEQNYPNPFNPSTNIWFDLPTKSEVSVIVFNLLGQEITTLVDETLPAGRHLTVWDGRDKNRTEVASGIYFYKIIAGDFVDTKKMMLVK